MPPSTPDDFGGCYCCVIFDKEDRMKDSLKRIKEYENYFDSVQ